ncbi:MAG: transporter substrate-binding domain-containing protein [Desulforhabdus sp.]|jgi:polar amino acid transport system substrate-binding protein|nr:transporter substrate-binding domain-containing protein [Desulforhabdus sp.]
MRRVHKGVFVLLLLSVLSGCAYNSKGKAASPNDAKLLERIIQKGELAVGTAASMPPFNMTTKSGEIIGLDIDIAKYVAAGMGVKLRIEAMPFEDLLPALKTGKVDMVISGMTITPQRNLKFSFVGPYFISGQAFLTKQEKVASAQQVSELNSPDISLAVLSGSTSQLFAEEAMPKARLVKAENYDQAVDMVLQSKVDALLADYPFCLVATLRHSGEGLFSILTLFTYEPLGIAVAQTDPHFINWLENFLDNMEGSGTLDELKSAWFEDDSWLKKLP